MPSVGPFLDHPSGLSTCGRFVDEDRCLCDEMGYPAGIVVRQVLEDVPVAQLP